ncbi:glucosamine-6-phosphate deaminase [Candidatus Poribacteria bacterium]|nr:glucosamine-6-phosphate deaminase [Candidatus Poribacteria bacterium]
MRVVVTSNVDAFATDLLVAKWASIRVLGLATGSTPVNVYGRLIQHYYDGTISFREKRTFNLDEYLGLAPNHPQSYRATMVRELMQYVDLPDDRFHVPPGISDDYDAACTAYEDDIRAAGGVDLWVLGVGVDGHIAFNEVGSAGASRTRVVGLAASTVAANAKYFDDPDEMPTQAITAGVATIMDAREVLLLAKGDAKANAIAKAVCGDETADTPASWLQGHGNCTFVLDRAAAAGIISLVGADATEASGATGRVHSLEMLG